MKKLCLLLTLLTLLLCSCLSDGFQISFSPITEDTTLEETTSKEITPEVSTTEETTPEETTLEGTTPEETTPEETTPEGTTPEETTPEGTPPEETTPEGTIPEVPPHEHLFETETVILEPTCAKAGKKMLVCACDESVFVEIPATGKHVYDNVVVNQQPTCTQPGFKRAVCECGAIEETYFDVSGAHNYQTSVVAKKPTCVEAGESVATCSVCGEVQTTIIPATGEHIYGEAVVSKAPTCIAEGEKTATCVNCTATEKTTIFATGIHLFGEAIVTKEATCVESGEKVATCTNCTATEKTTIPVTGVHIYENGICSICGYSPIPLYSVPSAYDADDDGENDIYYFSPTLIDSFKSGIHVWAGDYLPESRVSTSSAMGIQHWYVTENQKPAQFILYSVTVPEDGQYEMVIHLRMKDAQERGTKYTINAGTAYEYTFETSYGHDGLDYTKLRETQTVGTYMYGIKVNLVAGENIIKIEQSSSSPKCQHYRDFYFVRTGDFHFHNYENETVTKQVTCATDGEKIATCSCGKTKVVIIPATQNHTYKNEVCTGCGKVYVPAGILQYDFLYDAPGFAGGTLTFLPETSDVYTFYWADATGKLKDYTMLYSDEFVADAEAEVTIQSFTAIPKGATRLLAVSGDGDVTYSYTIPESRLFTEEELYTFGALSDTHQGTRYGSTSIPYNHFINAAKVLYEKGAITIGICGDFSYDNIESEYILHAKAIQEIYKYAPDMPIFTTSGNHESKYTGFSYDWYMEYTRGVVDYESDLDYTNFGKDNIDYVVELPDGSVMIFLHQLYYDYGSSYSRLLDDHQLDWLEERLEEYKDRTVFLFFHTFMDEQVGDATTSGNEYGLPLISSTVEYKKFDELFQKYTNVVYFSGHSHWAFDSQLVTPKPGKTNYDKNIDDKDGTYATMVHIPACSTPRVLVGSGDDRSEGYIVHVYENYVVFEGYEFVQGETFAYATFIIGK